MFEKYGQHCKEQ